MIRKYIWLFLIITLDEFSTISGLKLNNNKYSVIKLGELINRNVNFCQHKKIDLECENKTTLGIQYMLYDSRMWKLFK